MQRIVSLKAKLLAAKSELRTRQRAANATRAGLEKVLKRIAELNRRIQIEEEKRLENHKRHP